MLKGFCLFRVYNAPISIVSIKSSWAFYYMSTDKYIREQLYSSISLESKWHFLKFIFDLCLKYSNIN